MPRGACPQYDAVVASMRSIGLTMQFALGLRAARLLLVAAVRARALSTSAVLQATAAFLGTINLSAHCLHDRFVPREGECNA